MGKIKSEGCVSPMSFSKKSLPGGNSGPSPMSASKKLPAQGPGSLRVQQFTPENVIKNA